MLISRPTWMMSVRCTAVETKLLVTDTTRGDDLLRARLNTWPAHPRALLTMCEGLALWHGLPLRVAVSADENARDCLDRVFYGGGLVDPHSPLVMLEVRPSRARARRRCVNGSGLGNFRRLRLMEEEEP